MAVHLGVTVRPSQPNEGPECWLCSGEVALGDGPWSPTETALCSPWFACVWHLVGAPCGECPHGAAALSTPSAGSFSFGINTTFSRPARMYLSLDVHFSFKNTSSVKSVSCDLFKVRAL